MSLRNNKIDCWTNSLYTAMRQRATLKLTLERTPADASHLEQGIALSYD
jgi:hypothetical protein